jgi:hypothetical protein
MFQNSTPPGYKFPRLSRGLVDGAAHSWVGAEIMEPGRPCPWSEPQFSLAVLKPDRSLFVSRGSFEDVPGAAKGPCCLIGRRGVALVVGSGK